MPLALEVELNVFGRIVIIVLDMDDMVDMNYTIDMTYMAGEVEFVQVEHRVS